MAELDEITAAALSGAPLFGGWDEPARPNPFNLGLGESPAALSIQLALPYLAQSMAAPYGLVPAQFLPTQNLYDQLFAAQYHAQQQRAMQIGSQRDAANLQQTVSGLMRMSTGGPLSLQQQQQAQGYAQTLQSAMPMLAAALGPDQLDQFFGSRGSATLLAQGLHRGLRFTRDPVTGGLGVSGESAGALSQEIYEQLYGPEADVSELRSLGAGKAGMLAQELAMRGMLGPSLGSLSSQERISELSRLRTSDDLLQMARHGLPGESQEEALRRLRGDGGLVELDTGAQRRMAERRLQREGREATPEAVEDARREMFEGPGSTLGQLQRAGQQGGLDAQALKDLQGLPGAEDLMRGMDAHSISSRVKGLSGVVAAMRDIFGDMGRPNAPMRELLNGLQALTQGSLQSMTPGNVERLVRQTQALAQQSGIGPQGLLGLSAQAASLADQLGLDRTLVPQATQGAAAFSGAFRDTARLDLPVFGGFSAEEATLLDQQSRMQAAASQQANQLAASVRMLEEGLIAPDTDLGRLAQAAKEGRRTYRDANNQERSIGLSGADWRGLTRDAGLSETVAASILSDRYKSQEYIRDFNLDRTTRELQGELDILPVVRNTFADTLSGEGRASGLEAALSDRGVVTGDSDRRIFNQDLGERLAERFMATPAEIRNDVQADNRFLAQAVEQELAAQVRRRSLAAGKSEADAEADVQAAVASLGAPDAQGVRQGALRMAAAATASLNTRIRTDESLMAYKHHVGMRQLQDGRTLGQSRAREAEASVEARLRTSYARLGRSGPISRLINEIQRADGTERLDRTLLKGLGFVEQSQVERRGKEAAGSAAEAARFAFTQMQAAERHRDASVTQAQADQAAAADAGDRDTASYVRRMERTAGADFRQTDAAYQSTRQRLEQEAQGRLGTLTDRGRQQQSLWVSVQEGLVEGGMQAKAALESLAREELGPQGRPEQLDDRYFAGKLAQPGLSDAERRRVEALQSAVRHLRQGQLTGRGSMAQEVQDAGYSDMRLSERQLQDITQLGQDAQQRLKKLGGASSDEDRRLAYESADRFMRHGRGAIEQMLTSPEDLAQLGHGSIARVEALAAKERRIQSLAKAANLSAGELLAGGGAASEEARRLQRELQDGLSEIQKIKASGKMPGEQGAAVAAPMSKRERQIAEELSEFSLGNNLGEADARLAGEGRLEAVARLQAEKAADELAKQGGLSLTHELRADLVAEISSSGNARGLMGALLARRGLASLAAEQGLIRVDEQGRTTIGGKSGRAASAAEAAELLKSGKLTARQAQEAIDRLDASKLDQAGRQEAERLRDMSEPLGKLDGSLDFSGAMQRVQAAPGLDRLGASDAKPREKMTLAGTLTLKDPHHVLLQADASDGGDVDHTAVPTNIFSRLFG